MSSRWSSQAIASVIDEDAVVEGSKSGGSSMGEVTGLCSIWEAWAASCSGRVVVG